MLDTLESHRINAARRALSRSRHLDACLDAFHFLPGARWHGDSGLFVHAGRRTPSTNATSSSCRHGGPIARDTWSYFFLREFLVSRGYAVLQMNFRGSSGYGDDWFFAAHQDWGGLTYDDVVDGARWAIQHNIADPKRRPSWAGASVDTLRLLGAQRNADLFRCAVDIAGVSDLELTEEEGYQPHQYPASLERKSAPTKQKLKLNSPRNCTPMNSTCPCS
jgi:hypothetical protein